MMSFESCCEWSDSVIRSMHFVQVYTMLHILMKCVSVYAALGV